MNIHVTAELRNPVEPHWFSRPPASKRHLGRAVMAATSAVHNVPLEDLEGHCRKRRYAWPRQEAMAAMRRLGMTYEQIGKYANRDHTSVIHGERAVAKRPNCVDLICSLALQTAEIERGREQMRIAEMVKANMGRKQ